MATGQDPRFLIAPNLEEYFVDKDTGLPLSAGIVTYFEDNSRTVLKPIYTISGSPPNYSYVPLPNPNTLSASGYPTDASGNNVRVYYFPFDGTPTTTTNTIDLYYITVQSSGGVPQFTREGWPDVTATSTSTTGTSFNFIPNGQFLAHNNIYDSNGLNPGKITTTPTFGTPIAQGGWYFEKPSGSTSTDLVTFSRIGSIIDNPTANPRFFVTVQNTIPGSDSFKYLPVRFPNVNMFASTTQDYTFTFTAVDNNNASSNVQVLLNKYFGAGGSSFTPVLLASFTLTGTDAIYTTSFTFGTNEAFTLGTDDSDYVELVLSLPTGITFSISAVDFALLAGTVTVDTYPYQTNADTFSRSVAGYMPTPNPNGLNLYLPLILTQQGVTFDSSPIGKVYAALYPINPSVPVSTTTNEIFCDGSQYLTAGYSPLGIPFSRLQSVLYNTTLNMPVFGTGRNYVTAYNLQVGTNEFYMSTNLFGAATGPANGANSPGFTYGAVTVSSSAGFNVQAYSYGTNTFYVIGTVAAPNATSAAAGTSGFTISNYNSSASNVNTFQVFSVTTTNASALAGTYWTFTSYTNPSTPHNYYVWYQVNGVGADPAPGGTGIKVTLPASSAYTAQDVAYATISAVNGQLGTIVNTVAGSTIPQGSFFTFTASGGASYYVWYSTTVGASPPAGPSGTGIQVLYTTGDSAATIASETIVAMNKAFFAVPDLRGTFLRGYDPNSQWDIDSGVRFGLPNTVFGNQIGTFEFSQFLSHNHGGNGATGNPSYFLEGSNVGGTTTVLFATGIAVSNTGNAAAQMPLVIQYNGGDETRPINAYVNWVIKY
jgi:hypothetical protein